MIDAKKMLDELLGSNVPGTETTVRDNLDKATQFARENPVATGALAAVLLGTRPGRRITGSALKIGGLAAIAGLAYKAWQAHNGGTATQESAAADEIAVAPKGDSFDPLVAPQGEQEFALTLIRAMIAAANADGHIDDDERQRIATKMTAAGADRDVQDFIAKELATPFKASQLAAAATTEAQKVQLYTASRLAVAHETDAERDYLDRLADRLGLDHALVTQIEATVGGAATG